jgi:hypothetical protein
VNCCGCSAERRTVHRERGVAWCEAKRIGHALEGPAWTKLAVITCCYGTSAEYWGTIAGCGEKTSKPQQQEDPGGSADLLLHIDFLLH